MAAPKGNKFAVKDKPKSKHVALMMRPDAAKILKDIAANEKTTMTQIIEKALLAIYPEKFDGLF